MKLTLFDLDHTVLNGDSDVLWCDFLIDKGVLGRTEFTARNADMAARYKAGTVGLKEFADFYVGTLAGRTALQWEPLRQEFLADRIVPRITPAAVALVDKHLEAGDLVVMTTATNRFITELTAIYFDIEHLIATEPEMRGELFTGATTGVLNMREGKVERLLAWLAEQQLSPSLMREAVFYSDSANDLPLLLAVAEPTAVDPDPALGRHAAKAGWPVLRLAR